MTKIYLIKEKDSYEIIAKGHATGSNEACAMVSALFYGLAGYLEEHPLAVSMKVNLEEGNGDIKFSGEYSGVLFDFMSTALRQVAYTYPKNISIVGGEII